ncbi:hypothetical protein HGRIS_008679 [Hohenbuehelia grisea]|uniref:VASt domain-containing protein n=1 Tax=Hohenbuehelia grisea TaxID=104357 RepID=A0ABR3J979_9AGAR
MPPSFFSKLIRPSPNTHARERISSEYTHNDRNRSPSPSSRRRRTASTADSSLATPSLTTADTINTRSSSTLTHNTTDSNSTNPNVSIVPPSPHSTTTNSLPNGSTPSLVKSKDGRATTAQTISHLPRASEARASLEDDLPTPTMYRPSKSSKTDVSFLNKQVLPSSSNTNLRQSAESSKTLANRSPALAPLDLPELRPQKSNRSMTQAPPPISTSLRTAITPGLPPNDSAPNGVFEGVPLVESPKDIHPPGLGGSVGGGGVPMERTPATQSTPPTPSRQATSNTDSGKKGKWGRSGTRKPTGLASAIAASGMAMANPAFSAPQQSQLNPPILSAAAQSTPTTTRSALTSSPPFLATDPSTASTRHGRATSADLSPRSGKSGRSRLSVNSNNIRRPSVSAHSDRNSDTYVDEHDYYSDSSDDEQSDSDDDLGDLDIGDDIPVTGFAVASSKRNADFHEVFPTIPDGDYLIEDYGCALQREILIQGRLYISENHICFHANIFGWITDLSIPIYDITALDKKMTAFVIPNAIQITTRQAKYTFASFLSRDTTFDVIFNIWRLARPEDSASVMSSAKSIDGDRHAIAAGVLGAAAAAASEGGGAGLNPAVLPKKQTQCACSKDGSHYSELALDTVVPGTPERIHNLMFASGFIKDFMNIDQKLIDVQIADWTPMSPDSKLLARNFSYIKPLNSSVGPKQTKCEIRDETVHCDFDDYVCMLTTTRTPDVPSGGVFSVKTRTCITWATAVSTRVVVTTQVEWTGRSFIKGIIERSAIEGQKVYHSDLDRAMRAYVQAHQSEFMPAGVDIAAIQPEPDANSPTSPTSPSAGGEKLSEEEVRKKREHERNRRGLQWAYDTFEGAYGVAKNSTSTALELVKDAWEQSTVTAILWFVIVILVASNIWTLMRAGRREDAARVRDRPLRSEEQEWADRERWFQGVVTALRDELAPVGKGETRRTHPPFSHGQGEVPAAQGAQQQPFDGQGKNVDWRAELGALEDALDKAEERLRLIRDGISEVKRGATSAEPLDSLD